MHTIHRHHGENNRSHQSILHDPDHNIGIEPDCVLPDCRCNDANDADLFSDTNYEMLNNFILIAFVHSVVLLSGLCMFYAYDTLLIVIFVNMLMVASIIVEDINELDCVLNKHKYAVKEPRQRLIKIIWMQKKIGG